VKSAKKKFTYNLLNLFNVKLFANQKIKPSRRSLHSKGYISFITYTSCWNHL